MPEPVSIQVGGNVAGSIVVGDHNFVVNSNHGTLVYQQAKPQAQLRQFAPRPPRLLRGFINRSAELAQIETWIGANEIVLLHAPDGMGKTALLKQAANLPAAKAMPNGVILLEGVDVNGQAFGPDDVIQHLFDALFESDPPLKVDSVSARTYLSNTRPLVLLDEVGLPPALQKTLPDLFPDGAILATADVAFGNDFQRLPIGPLPRPEAINLLVTGSEMTLKNANRASLDAICAFLNDVSLAIVITSNVLRETGISPEAAIQEIQNISTTERDPVAAGIDRAFLFAFNRLSPETRKVLSAAALTPGVSISTEWLSAALGGVEVEAFVERLKTLGLLYTNSPRLRLPPGFRAPAQRAAVLDEETLLPRLIKFLLGPLQDNPQDWEYIKDELGNFFGALAWAIRNRRWGDVISLGRALDPYLCLHGLWDAWNTALGYILDAARESGEQSVQAWALHQGGTRAIGVGTREQALDLLRQALELRRGLGDTVGMAYTQHNIDMLIGPPPGRNGAKPKPPKPGGGGNNLFWVLGGMGMLGLAALAVVVAFLVFPPFPTITPLPPVTATFTSTPQDTDTPTPLLTSTSTASPTPTLTPTVTLTPTPRGGSGTIAFQSETDGSSILYVTDLDNSKLREVTKDTIAQLDPAWSPDGESLAYVLKDGSTSSKIYIAKADGSNPHQLTTSGGTQTHPTWSRDGNRIAFINGDPLHGSDIYIIDIDTGGFKDLTNSDGTGHYDYPEWSPDGSRIAYQNLAENDNLEIFVINVDGLSDPIQLTRLLKKKNVSSIQPSWSPDGRQIAFTTDRNGNFDIYVMNSDGSNQKVLMNDKFDDTMPDWSPDGRLIAFSSNRDGNIQIYIIAADGSGALLQVTKTNGTNSSSEPDWRP